MNSTITIEMHFMNYMKEYVKPKHPININIGMRLFFLDC